MRECRNEDPRTQLLLIFDDMLANPLIWKDENMIKLFLLGRHKNITFLFTFQSTNNHKIPQEVRDNIDMLFIGSMPSVNVIDKIFTHYTDVFKNKNEFRQILNSITKDFRFLVLNKKIRSDQIQDKVFHYKARINIPSFKVGSPEIWLFDRARKEKEVISERKNGNCNIRLIKN